MGDQDTPVAETSGRCAWWAWGEFHNGVGGSHVLDWDEDKTQRPCLDVDRHNVQNRLRESCRKSLLLWSKSRTTKA